MTSDIAAAPAASISADELAAWRVFSEGGQLLEELIDRRLRESVGLSHADYGVLRRLQDAAGNRMAMRDLRHEVWFSRSRLTHQIKRLQAAGLVTKAGDSRDARRQDVALTSEGLELITRSQQLVRRLLREHFFDQLPSGSVAGLQEMLGGMLRHLRAQPECQSYRNS